MSVSSFLKSLLPVKLVAAAEQVAPEIQSKIDLIRKNAEIDVKNLLAVHSAASIQQQMEDDIKAVSETAAHHIALIKQLAAAKLGQTAAVLPTVSSQFGAAPTGPTGAAQ